MSRAAGTQSRLCAASTAISPAWFGLRLRIAWSTPAAPAPRLNDSRVRRREPAACSLPDVSRAGLGGTHLADLPIACKHPGKVVSRMQDDLGKLVEIRGGPIPEPGRTSSVDPEETTPWEQVRPRQVADATAGHEGDPKLLTAFPTECRCDADRLVSQIVEGPISSTEGRRQPD